MTACKRKVCKSGWQRRNTEQTCKTPIMAASSANSFTCSYLFTKLLYLDWVVPSYLQQRSPSLARIQKNQQARQGEPVLTLPLQDAISSFPFPLGQGQPDCWDLDMARFAYQPASQDKGTMANNGENLPYPSSALQKLRMYLSRQY
jgi:hypothetical protein